MNITTVLNEIALNEGHFFSSKYKDKDQLIPTALQVIDTIFSKKTANDIRFGFNKTKFREMADRDSERKNGTSGYNNSPDTDAFDSAISKYRKEHPEAEKDVYKVRSKFYKKATKALDKPRIYLNTKQWKERNLNDARKVMTLVHEMIHTVQKYTPSILKAQKDIYNIYKENWKGPGPFSLSKVMLGSDKFASEARLSEILTYLVSDVTYTEYLTEEGVEKLISYLKSCGLINPNDELGFWESKFEEFREDNKREAE